MEIIIASDSHGQNRKLNQIREAFPQADLFLHAGDFSTHPDLLKDWILVTGNNDTAYEGKIPDQRIIEAEGHRILLLHGHTFHKSRRQGLHQELIREARKRNCDIVVYGHTHALVMEQEDGIWILNPGSVYRAARNQEKGFIRLHLEKDCVQPEFISWKDFEN